MSENLTKENAPLPEKGGRKFKNDLILICAIILVIAITAVCLFAFNPVGDTVRVTVDGRLYGTYPLSKDTTVEIKTGGYNILVIENGEAWVSEASCPDGICSSHRPINRDGESIICLPNKVVIEVRVISDNAPDIVN